MIPLNMTFMLPAFQQHQKPTRFLTGMLQLLAHNIQVASEVLIDIQRYGKPIAVDITRHAGSRLHKFNKFSEEKYTPPFYDEADVITARDLEKRFPGQNPFDNPTSGQQLQALLVDRQLSLQGNIVRAIEYLTAQMFFTGVIVLVNGDSLDFNQKASHQFTGLTPWSAGGNPFVDLGNASGANKKDAGVTSDIGIFGQDALQLLFSNTIFKDAAKLEKVDILTIKPPTLNADGGVFHGMLSVGSYKIQVWTYPEDYDVPMGYDLPNEGTTVPYVPTDRVLVMSSKARKELVFAGVPSLVPAGGDFFSNLNLSQIPQNVAGEFVPWAALDIEKVALKYGVKSAPLPIPIDIDSYSWLEVS